MYIWSWTGARRAASAPACLRSRPRHPGPSSNTDGASSGTGESIETNGTGSSRADCVDGTATTVRLAHLQPSRGSDWHPLAATVRTVSSEPAAPPPPKLSSFLNHGILQRELLDAYLWADAEASLRDKALLLLDRLHLVCPILPAAMLSRPPAAYLVPCVPLFDFDGEEEGQQQPPAVRDR